MAWPDAPDDYTDERIQKILEDQKDKTMRCPHCDNLVFKVDVIELGYCPECEETIK